MFYCEICSSGDCCERCDLPMSPTLCDWCYEKAIKEKKDAPDKCVDCIHHKQSKQPGGYISYCDYTEYYTENGIPAPYPYFFKQEYPCKGHEVREV